MLRLELQTMTFLDIFNKQYWPISDLDINDIPEKFKIHLIDQHLVGQWFLLIWLHLLYH